MLGQKPPRDQRTKRGRGSHHSADVDAIVREIMNQMLDGKWQLSRSAMLLAEKHGVAIDTVHGWSAQASRYIRMSRGKPEDILERILLSIDRAEQICFETKKSTFHQEDRAYYHVPAPDLKSLHDFLRLQCEVHGFIGPAASKRREAGTEEIPIEQLKTLLDELGFNLEPKESDDGGEQERSEAEEDGVG